MPETTKEYEPGWCPLCGDPEELCRAMGGCSDSDDEPESEGDLWEFDCGMDRQGNCGKAGSEECDFECPNRNVKRN